MTKTILITGGTDGIGLLTAKLLAAKGHKIVLHGRSAAKLVAAAQDVGGDCETFLADFASLPEVAALADAIKAKHETLDVLINNAGVLKTEQTTTATGHDIRFVVNAFAPYALTQALLPIMPKDGRVVNVSSAAQAPVDMAAMKGETHLRDMEAYSQSKLAITIWSREMAQDFPDGPVIVAVNPGSLLASKMVQEGFGIAGNDLAIGANILCKAALDPAFADVSGQYFDNDAGTFAAPHSAAQNAQHVEAVMRTLKAITAAM